MGHTSPAVDAHSISKMNSARIVATVTTVAAVTGVNGDINGGVLLDPNHYVPGSGSLAGTRMMTDRQGDAVSGQVLLIGSDDGSNFWSLRGKNTGGQLSVDFSPKGG